MQRFLFIAVLVSITGCTTYKLWNDAGSDSDLGTVKLSYEYRKYESPQVDERAGVQMARERCKVDVPPLRELEPGHWSACHFAEELQAAPSPIAPPSANPAP